MRMADPRIVLCRHVLKKRSRRPYLYQLTQTQAAKRATI